MVFSTKLDEFMAREAIRDCLYTYARGIDRADEEALISSYWPDAYDCHGAYEGPVMGFIDRVRNAWSRGPRNIHHVTNILIDFQSQDRAHVEAYFLALQRGTTPDGVASQVMLSGRYCDIFTQRNGEWRVQHRTVVYDWVDPQIVPSALETDRFGPRQPIGTSWPDDVVYGLDKIQV